MNNMKRLMLLTFISIALASLTAGAQTKNAAPENADSTQEIRAWLDRWTKAFTKQDVDRLIALITNNSFRSTKVICTSKSAICTSAPPGTSVTLPGWN